MTRSIGFLSTITVVAAVALSAAPAGAQAPDAAAFEAFVEEHIRVLAQLQQTNERERERAERIQRESERRRTEAARRRQQLERQVQARNARSRADVRDWPEVSDTITRVLRLGRTGTLDLENVAGNVVISGGGGDEVRIQAIKRLRSPNESQARALLPRLEMQVAERPGAVEVRTRQPRARNLVGSMTYTVTVPSGTNVIVRTMSGDVRVSNVRGEVRAETMNGSLQANGIGRLQSVKSFSGVVEITDAEGGDVVAESINGDVLIRNLKARSVDLQTVSGDVRLTDVEIERLGMRSTNGSFDYTGRFVRNGRFEVQTHIGDIRITPIGNPGFDVEASTFTGDVRSDFMLKLLQELPTQAGVNRRLRGTFGTPGAFLSLRTFQGDIVLVRR